MPDYRLTMSAKQADVVKHALELYSRICIGQIPEIAREFESHPRFVEIREALERVQCLITGSTSTSLAIGGSRTPVEAKIAWETHQVIRQMLAYARKPEGDWTVDFRDPLAISGEPLPAIQATDEMRDCRPTNVRLSDELRDEIGTDSVREAVMRVRAWKKAGKPISERERKRLSKLVARLRASSQGETVWRVADVTTHAYCIEFTRRDSACPETECRAWFEENAKRFPDKYANMAVESQLVFTEHEMLSLESADAIEKMLAGKASRKKKDA